MDDVKKVNTLENTKKKLKANMTSVGEWFKQAAWLQVVLIVGVIFGLLLSIPAIVKCAEDLSEDSKLFKDSNISYTRLLDEDGRNTRNNSGLVGDGLLSGAETYSTELEGFVVLFYNVNDDTFMGDQQKNFEEALENLQKDNEEIKNKIKFFTIDVSWNPDWTTSDDNDYSSTGNYVTETTVSSSKSPRMSLEEQNSYLKDVILPTYISQANGSGKYGNNTNYVSSDVKISDIQNSDLTSDYAGNNASTIYHTIPTCFVTYVKNKSDEKYDIKKPDKVRFRQSLSLDTAEAAKKEIMDLYNFQIKASQKIA